MCDGAYLHLSDLNKTHLVAVTLDQIYVCCKRGTIPDARTQAIRGADNERQEDLV